MPRIASLSPHELRGCTLRVTLTALLRLRLESRQIRADSGRSYEGCRKSEKLRDEGPLSSQRPFLLLAISVPKLEVHNRKIFERGRGHGRLEVSPESVPDFSGTFGAGYSDSMANRAATASLRFRCDIPFQGVAVLFPCGLTCACSGCHKHVCRVFGIHWAPVRRCGKRFATHCCVSR